MSGEQIPIGNGTGPQIEGQVNVELWLADPALDEIRGLWRHFRGKNWKVILVPGRLPRKGEKRNRVLGSPLAQVDSERKVLEIEMSPNMDEPFPLTLPGEILRLQSLRLFEANSRGLFARVRDLTGEAQASDDDLRCLFKFLVERDVLRGKWRTFQKLYSAHPGPPTEFWESIQLERDPLRKITELLKDETFHLLPDALKKLGEFPLDTVMLALGGWTETFLDAAELRTARPLPSPIRSLAELKKIVPAVLVEASFLLLNPAYAEIAANLALPEVSRLENFLSLPWLIACPSDAERQLQPLCPELRWADMTAHLVHALHLLSAYGIAKGQPQYRSRAFERGLELLENLRPGTDPRENYQYFNAVKVQAIEILDQDQSALWRFYGAVRNSPSRLAHSWRELFDFDIEILLKVIGERGDALRLPDPEHVRVVVDDSIAHDYARAEVSLDHRGHESRIQAATTAESAARYFAETGEPALAQRYRALEERFRREANVVKPESGGSAHQTH